jgi:hypothetical protein
MATVSEPTPGRGPDLHQDHVKVRSPLEKLRGYIRTYVSLEGAAVVGVYLALWFWVGMFLDYGVFKLSSLFDPAHLRPIDWVQILPWWLRAGILGALVAGLVTVVALKVLNRLFRTFSDPAVAIVLERRFPEELGDRLITAVEMSDPQQAAQYGYSPAMVRATIHEAAERVDRVPVNEVFDWARLKKWWVFVGLLTVVLFLLTGLGFCTANAIRTGSVGAGGFLDLGEVSIVWFERNILLRNVIWPRRAHLELVGFPPSGEEHIGKGKQAPNLRVRALEYVISGAPTADAQARYEAWLEARGVEGEEVARAMERFRKSPPEGWRALTWYDLDADLLGAAVPDITFPSTWTPRAEEHGLTLDWIEVNFRDDEKRAALSEGDAEAIGKVLEHLDQRASERGMSRTLRKLKVPETVELIFTGEKTGNVTSTTLERTGENEYTGGFGELKESVRFTVQGEDYSTATRYITVEEPPGVESLMGEEAQPAYLFYRLPEDVGPEPLRGKKQRFEANVVSVQGGETSLITVPAGTDLTLIGRATKPLTSVAVVPSRADVVIEAGEVELDEGDRVTFHIPFANVRRKQDFLIKMVDTFGVEGTRQVVVRPADDLPPAVREFGPGDLVRKTKEGYMMTVTARIPFVGNVQDDRGLANVRYAYTLMRADLAAGADAGARYLMGLSPVMAPGGGATVLTGVSYLMAGRVAVPKLEAMARTDFSHRDIPRFWKEVEERRMPGDHLPKEPAYIRNEVMALTRAQDLLNTQQRLPYRQLLQNFRITPDPWERDLEDIRCDFPAWELGLKVVGERRVQPRYKMEVWLEASDQAVDNVPPGQRGQKSVSTERYTIILVSESELLAEIAKEEELKYNELKSTYDHYNDSEGKLEQTVEDLSSGSVKVENLPAMSVRCNQVLEALERAHRETHDVYVAYDRILRELKANRVQAKHIERVDNNIVSPLRKLDEFEFDKARDRLVAFRRALDDDSLEAVARIAGARKAGDQAKEQLREVKDQLFQILGAMEGLVDVNRLVKWVREIDEAEQEQRDKLNRVYLKLITDLFNKGLPPETPEKKP